MQKTLRKNTATRQKQDLFFDFAIDLFQSENGNKPDSNKFLSRALHACDANNFLVIDGLENGD